MELCVQKLDEERAWHPQNRKGFGVSGVQNTGCREQNTGQEGKTEPEQDTLSSGQEEDQIIFKGGLYNSIYLILHGNGIPE